MKFLTIKAEDKDKIQKIIGKNPERICENTFGIMYIWSVHDEYSYCIEDGTLYFGLIDDSTADFYYPIGFLDEKTAIDKLINYCKEKKLNMRFSFLSKSQAKFLTGYLNEKVSVAEDRDWSDYLYNYEDLSTLKGKKYNGQRNHINKFLKEYPEHIFLPYKEEFYDDALVFLEQYFENLNKENQWLRDERFVMENKLLKQFSLVDQMGAVIKVGEKIIAMAFGEIVGDTLYVHFEKALREYKGSYAQINQKFAQYCYSEGVKYINREEDLGDFGLRTAKLSLHPVEILPKFFAKIDI